MWKFLTGNLKQIFRLTFVRKWKDCGAKASDCAYTFRAERKILGQRKNLINISNLFLANEENNDVNTSEVEWRAVKWITREKYAWVLISVRWYIALKHRRDAPSINSEWTWIIAFEAFLIRDEILDSFCAHAGSWKTKGNRGSWMTIKIWSGKFKRSTLDHRKSSLA
jgi:hypothetical protein